jgi:hypothetical protein
MAAAIVAISVVSSGSVLLSAGVWMRLQPDRPQAQAARLSPNAAPVTGGSSGVSDQAMTSGNEVPKLLGGDQKSARLDKTVEPEKADQPRSRPLAPADGGADPSASRPLQTEADQRRDAAIALGRKPVDPVIVSPPHRVGDPDKNDGQFGDPDTGVNNTTKVMGLGGAPPGTDDSRDLPALPPAGPDAGQVLKDNAAVDSPGNRVASLGPLERATPSEGQAEKPRAPEASEIIPSSSAAQPDATVPVRLPGVHRVIADVTQAASSPVKVVSRQAVHLPTASDLAADRFIDPAGTAR